MTTTTKFYVAGAWTEQHQRARPMIRRLEEAGLLCTCDWTVIEGDVCECEHHRQAHAPFAATRPAPHDPVGSYWRAEGSTRCETCACPGFNGIGPTGDSHLSSEDRRRHARADLDGVLTADVLLLLAENGKGACGSWCELGAALAARRLREDSALTYAKIGGSQWRGGPERPYIIVAGVKARRSIFTELADQIVETDDEGFHATVTRAHTNDKIVMWGGKPMREGRCPPGDTCLACDRLGKHLEPAETGAVP